jgi:hypothetical protein
MAGEPEGVFDVTKLEVIETDAAGVEHSSSIIDVGEAFKLRATIKGKAGDPTWEAFKAINAPVGVPDFFQVRARFYAEGMGPGVPNRFFGALKFVSITADEFTVDSDVVTVGAQGIYRCGVRVNVFFYWDPPGAPPPITIPWRGWLGYNEDCVLEVNPFET